MDIRLGKDLRTNQKLYVSGLILLLVLIVLMFPIKGVNTSSDSGSYLLNGLRLYLGQGFDFQASWKGPVFPTMIAATFHLFGVSVTSAMVLVRLAWALNVILVLLIGRALFGPGRALLAAFLVLTSYVVNYWSSKMLLDSAVPCFLLISTYVGYLAIKRVSWVMGALFGVFLGVSFLSKQTALLFLPLPFLLWGIQTDFRDRRRFVIGLVSVFAFGLSLLPWGLYLVNSDYGYLSLLGSIYHKSVSFGGEEYTLGLHIIKIILLNGPQAFFMVLKRIAFEGYSPLIVLSIVGWIYLLVRYVRKRLSEDLYLLLCVLCFLPVVISTGKMGWRLGQLVYFYDISYLALAVLSVDGLHMFKTAVWHKRRMILCVLVIGAMVGLQVVPTMIHYKRHGKFYPAMTNATFQVGGRHSSDVMAASEWILENLPPGETIITDGYIEEAIPFYTHLKYKVVYFNKWHTLLSMAASREMSGLEEKAILAVWTNDKLFTGNASHRQIFAILRGEFYAFLANTDARYFFTTSRSRFYWTYFENVPWAKVHIDSGNLRVYEIDREQMLNAFGDPSQMTFVGSGFLEAIKWLEKNDIRHYERISDLAKEIKPESMVVF